MSVQTVRVRDIDHAVDLFIAECGRERLAVTTQRKYRQLLDRFSRQFSDKHPLEITVADIDEFMAPYRRRSPNYEAFVVTVVKRFFGFMVDEDIIEVDPSRKLKPPRKQRPLDLNVLTVDRSDVEALWSAALRGGDWSEILCLALLSLLGPRRAAAARLRRSDVDLNEGTVRFYEKGGREIIKELPHDLAAIVHEADSRGVWSSLDDYFIPARRLRNNDGERSTNVVYNLVKAIGARAGVAVHPHSLRAAFAVNFAEHHPGAIQALKEIMGHRQFETTEIYLRRQNKRELMSLVKDVSWFPSVSDALAQVQQSEPLNQSGSVGNSISDDPAAEQPSPPLPNPLRRKLDALREETPTRERS